MLRAANPLLRCPYAILGIAKGDDVAAKTRFRELALKHHPDRGGDEQTFIRVKQAYESIVTGVPTIVPTARPAAPYYRATVRDEHTILDLRSLPESTFLYKNMVTHRSRATTPLRRGMLLYATKGAGPRFARCVLVLAEVSARGGTIGYVVNKPVGEGWWGGPNGHRGHSVLMHKSTAFAAREEFTTREAAGLYFDTAVQAAKVSHLQNTPHFKVISGYCGWLPGALEKIIRRGAWRVLDTSQDNPDWLVTLPHDEVYSHAETLKVKQI